MDFKLHILAIAAHPDDVELSCGGTLANEINRGKKVGIIDLTRGELGTRGTPETREEEAQKAASLLGIRIRKNLEMADGLFSESYENLMKVVEVIRQFMPDVVLTNSVSDRHPDHGRGGDLVERACFLAGLAKVETSIKGVWQEPWRPKVVYRFVQDRYIKPDFIVDVTESWNIKMEAIKAFKSQFYDPNSEEPETPISGKQFLDFLEARSREFGREIGVEFGEGFCCSRRPGVKQILDLI
ncbi:bacillithiol biosynthesis deacetylase BshB1 [Luteibaculum oceani]|uniref:Bacillithiol biosynthesis deacetylase BshB1 n=1 Tax=Luteibaculum oceani TaxID=1294296 RepID=A0A5C6VAD4_9FLAO|nr:bacillithiol biosynthesis deacetylase BshB1 [Luteibaculum oceani]TXC81461.1 bacillithiol biosynthesis deacetylase BshB1 [Luteibaculum oceani]